MILAASIPHPSTGHEGNAVAPAFCYRGSEPVVEKLDVVGDDDLHVRRKFFAIQMQKPEKLANSGLVLIGEAVNPSAFVPLGRVVCLGGLVEHQKAGHGT